MLVVFYFLILKFTNLEVLFYKLTFMSILVFL